MKLEVAPYEIASSPYALVVDEKRLSYHGKLYLRPSVTQKQFLKITEDIQTSLHTPTIKEWVDKLFQPLMKEIEKLKDHINER